MFKDITLRNFRTHKVTNIELHPVTLFIGNNNSGKTNFLAGIQHFSGLVRRGRPGHRDRTVKATRDLYPHQNKFANNQPIGFRISWNNAFGEITYEMEVYENQDFAGKAGCKEKININLFEVVKTVEISSGYEKATDAIALRGQIENDTSLPESEKRLCSYFFRDLAYTFDYHFQPSFLKGLVQNEPSQEIDEATSSTERIKIPAMLGHEGRNFQKIIAYLTQTEDESEKKTFARFTALMRRFNPNFYGTQYDSERSKLTWLFDLGRKATDRPLDGFPPNVLSDGFLKAGAISLLVSLRDLPALILLEEIENGINPGNVQELMNWIWQTTSPDKEGYAPQFIITSHSPSVLREFSDHLDYVYNFRFDKRNVQSDVRNLNDALDVLVGVGTVEGEIIEDEKTGKRLVKIPKYQLAELWYSGAIG